MFKMKSFMKVASLVMLIMGIVKLLGGDGVGGVLIIAGLIADLQAGHMDLTERILAIEKKEKKDATQSTQGS